MAKRIVAKVKILLKAGQASPGPPVATSLGIQGINIMNFVNAFNQRTVNKPEGEPTPVEVTIYVDKSFTFVIKKPPASHLLKQAAKIVKGSEDPLRDKVGVVSIKDVERIAKIKLEDLNTTNLDAAMRTIQGTARSMGIQVKED